MIRALIDADVVMHMAANVCQYKGFMVDRVLFNTKTEAKEYNKEGLPIEVVQFNKFGTNVYEVVDGIMRRILKDTKVEYYSAYISGKDNFRYKIDPEYKANRSSIKPIHLSRAKDRLVKEWGSEVVDGMEADDALGIKQKGEDIVCSTDKDLLMIEGSHYRIRDKHIIKVKRVEGLKWFCKQMLMGDTIDNIYGIRGIGPKRADKLISVTHTVEESWKIVKEVYKTHKRDKDLMKNAKLLWILREPKGYFKEEYLNG